MPLIEKESSLTNDTKLGVGYPAGRREVTGIWFGRHCQKMNSFRYVATGVERFPEEWLMRLNLAGEKEICAMTLADPDLKPLWDKILPLP
jgi:hypothetical protein